MNSKDERSPEEARRLSDKVLRRMLDTPPHPKKKKKSKRKQKKKPAK